MTLVLKTDLSLQTRSQLPKPSPTSPRHKRQNRRSGRTALPTTSAPALSSNRQTKTAVLPSKTSATQNGRSPTNAPKFPKSYPTNLRRNRQNRCLCQPAWPKTSAPTLPGNRQTKPAFAHQNLRRNAKANQPTDLNFAPPCQSSDQAQNDPKLVAELRWRLLPKADALPKRSKRKLAFTAQAFCHLPKP